MWRLWRDLCPIFVLHFLLLLAWPFDYQETSWSTDWLVWMMMRQQSLRQIAQVELVQALCQLVLREDLIEDSLMGYPAGCLVYHSGSRLGLFLEVGV